MSVPHEQLSIFADDVKPRYHPDYAAFDIVAIQLSGGKDSVACTLKILEDGCPPDKILLCHQDVDGREDDEFTFDWAITRHYVELFAQRFNLRLEFQWRQHGILGEVLKDNSVTKGVSFEHNGQVTELAPGIRATANTRLKWPGKTGDMRLRWCSSLAKMDVSDRVMRSHPDFQNKSILFVSGERWSESTARANRSEVETHKASSKKRPITHWRPIVSWTERQVWDILKKHKVLPHLSYLLGYTRCSCLTCVFNGPQEWNGIKEIFPERFEKIASLEEQLKFTIDPKETVRELAARGKSRLPVNHLMYPKWLEWAQNPDSLQLEDMTWEEWEYPAGAFIGGRSGGAP